MEQYDKWTRRSGEKQRHQGSSTTLPRPTDVRVSITGIRIRVRVRITGVGVGVLVTSIKVGVQVRSRSIQTRLGIVPHARWSAIHRPRPITVDRLIIPRLIHLRGRERVPSHRLSIHGSGPSADGTVVPFPIGVDGIGVTVGWIHRGSGSGFREVLRCNGFAEHNVWLTGSRGGPSSAPPEPESEDAEDAERQSDGDGTYDETHVRR